MVYHTINRSFMKKISKFIPDKVIKKKERIDELNAVLKNNLDNEFIDKINVINFSESIVIIECNDSSVASIIKFEREKYLQIFKDFGMYNLQDLRVKLKPSRQPE
jgi:hypothetical protein